MKSGIAPEIIAATTKCRKAFLCLTQPGKCVCKAVHCVRDQILFIDKAGPDDCPYLLAFGKGYICTCPTRKAVYDRYRV